MYKLVYNGVINIEWRQNMDYMNKEEQEYIRFICRFRAKQMRLQKSIENFQIKINFVFTYFLEK